MIITLFFKVLIFHLFFIWFCRCKNEVLKVSQDSHENLLILSTIDGNIHLLDRYTGELKWSTKLSPFIKTISTNGSMLIPNPINGQLYIFHQNDYNKDIFSPLEYNLYDYVKKTPLFMENMLLTGSKSDQWLSVDIDTGQIVHKFETGNMENCPQQNAEGSIGNRTIYIGICQYNLIISEPSSRQIIYNVLLNSLTTHAVSDLEEHNMRHYASSDSGLVVTKYKTNDVESGWSLILDSSVIGLYSITTKGILNRLQFTSMSHETLSHLFLNNFPWNQNQISLKKAIFFGQTFNSWYVLKTFIDQNNKLKPNIRQHLPLITGPMNGIIKNQTPNGNESFMEKGFYELPVEKYISHQNRVFISNYLLDFDKNQLNTALISKQNNNSNYSHSKLLQEQDSMHIRFISILVAATFIMVTYIAYFLTKQNFKSSEKKHSISSSYNEITYEVSNSKSTSDSEKITIGDLSYSPNEILGYGTNGTAVFRGVFLGNDRHVAVKRLLTSERSHYELKFLRQAFDCNHLIKCFYITQSREFTFLALELCECTLEEYVSNSTLRKSCGLDKITACNQMMIGVHFLHDKGIVHRDLKPRNVLLMKMHKVKLRENSNYNNDSDPFQYKVVISDFGLSRQSIDYGVSITKTGCGGTSGYMAPELSRDDVKRISINTDIFSCGILFYYILTEGQHPFGEEILSRQHRIHKGILDLNESLIEDRMFFYFINAMLKPSPLDRPSAEEILHGPLFWKSIQKLSFLCDVSDFIEKNGSSLQNSLDKQSDEVFHDKWTDSMEDELIKTLTSQRTYKTKHLSHLIRALRNKRNHFHELPSHVSEKLFNSNHSGLAIYIDKKFPNLYATVYQWVRCRLDCFPNSIRQYFPNCVLLSADRILCSSSDNDSEDFTERNQDEENILEWRKPKRKRPTKVKKIRGTKTIKNL